MDDEKKSILNSEFVFQLNKKSIFYNTTFLSFFIPFTMGLMIFFPLCVWTKGIFIYFGDFNSQQIPFYILCHDAVRNGEIGWNWITDLGANFIGSYSFYLLGSPFFWLTIPFPSACVPYLMAPLFVLKLSFMGLSSYIFFTKFVSKKMALIGSILYVFSGYTIHNVVYNHFLEAMIFFPLILYALECRMEGSKKGLFAFFVFLSALNNYFFFIGQAVFLLLYFFMRYPTANNWNKKFGNVAGLFFEAIVGTGMATFILLPSYLAVSGNYRSNTKLAGWDILLYVSPKRYLDIIHSFFFPQDNPVFYNFFDYEPNEWQSVSAWVPMFGCTGALAYFFSKERKNWLRRLLITLLCFSVVPVLNASFQLFSQQYYARWFYMFTIVIILATLLSIENSIKDSHSINWKRAFKWSGIAVFSFSLIGIVPTSWNFKSDNQIMSPPSLSDSWGLSNEKISFGLETYKDKFWIYVTIATVGLALSAFLIWMLIKRKKSCYKILLACLCVYSYSVTLYILSIGQDKIAQYYPASFYTDLAIGQSNQLEIPIAKNNEFYRYDFYDGKNECFMGVYWKIPSIQSFHSIIPTSSMNYYNSIGVGRSVASLPQTDFYSIRSFLSVKYLLDYNNVDGPYYIKSCNPEFFQDQDTSKTAMPGYTYVKSANGYDIYENKNYIPMGFTYDSYITESELSSLDIGKRDLMMLKAMTIEDRLEDSIKHELNHRNISKCIFSEEEYVKDCKERNEYTASSFTVSKDGFVSTISLKKDNYVFFSVPYEKGWTAEVNNQKAEIIKANIGFIAIKCSKGENIIRFRYETPGLKTGLMISLVFACIFTMYFMYMVLKKRLSNIHKNAKE